MEVANQTINPDFSRFRLGRKAVRTDSRTLRVERYMASAMPPAPHSHKWSDGITSFGMMDNDTLGDCTIAACGHGAQIWTANAATELTVSDSTILGAYEKWCGYVNGDPNTDNGGIPLDVLNDWVKDGLGGVQLSAFMSATVSNTTLIKQSIMLFGGVYIGLELPITAQTQSVWDVVPNSGANGEPGSWGGHCVFVPDFDGDANTVHGFTCVTWGQLLRMTKSFWLKYVDEAYTLLSPSWIAANQLAPSGFNIAQLEADLKTIRTKRAA